MTETKRCSKCRVTKPLDQFEFHAKTLDKAGSWCDACRKAWHREDDERWRAARDAHERLIVERAAAKRAAKKRDE